MFGSLLGRLPFGLGRAKDARRAGDAKAADLFLRGCGGLAGSPADYPAAFQWFEQAARLGHPGAQLNLGLLYASGLGVDKDEAQAAKWYCAAAEQGCDQACFNLAVAHCLGAGVGKDLEEAARWYQRAADLGDCQALGNLGLMYLQGQGVEQDHAEAFVRLSSAVGLDHKAVQPAMELARKILVGDRGDGPRPGTASEELRRLMIESPRCRFCDRAPCDVAACVYDPALATPPPETPAAS